MNTNNPGTDMFTNWNKHFHSWNLSFLSFRLTVPEQLASFIDTLPIYMIALIVARLGSDAFNTKGIATYL